MEWERKGEAGRLPIKSWCREPEAGAMEQVERLTLHPLAVAHVALMPDCHQGFGMPIGGVLACRDALIPNAVGVDIGCGMVAVETGLSASSLCGLEGIRELLREVKELVPVGEGRSHSRGQFWDGFSDFLQKLGAPPAWLDERGWTRDQQNLGTLGGGNHFIEIQVSEEGRVWLMIHSGSRNLGHRIATHYHGEARALNAAMKAALPDEDLAWLPAGHELGQGYIRDMSFALAYARENRRRMMSVLKERLCARFSAITFGREVNIHHNYAALEEHLGQKVWLHRKGATSARFGELGIIPGSMGTSSYIVRGRGNPESFDSCSHGAGRRMGRLAASRSLSASECDEAMKGIVFDRWSKIRGKGAKAAELLDLGEAPQAYKDIDEVIAAQRDLIEPLVRLRPLGVIKG
ncbi:MAG: RtcB family protein [Planctomycetes bacterium]|nr:RtcB family protein [Planctomycetota bacterium]